MNTWPPPTAPPPPGRLQRVWNWIDRAPTNRKLVVGTLLAVALTAPLWLPILRLFN